MSEFIQTLNKAGVVEVSHDKGCIVLRLQACDRSFIGVSVAPAMLAQLARQDIVHTSSLPLVRTRTYGYHDVVILMIGTHLAVVPTARLAQAANIHL